MKRMSTEEDIYKIIQHVLTARDVLKRGFSKWRHNCEKTLPSYTGTTHSPKTSEQKIILDRLCTTPSYFDKNIINPLFSWLETFYKLSKKEMALTGPDALDKFIRDGVNHVYRFVVVLNYFVEFVNNFVTESSLSVTSQEGKTQFMKRQQIKQEIRNSFNDHIEELIGCKDTLSTRLLELTKGIKAQYYDSVEDKIKYLTNTCTNIRYQRLK